MTLLERTGPTALSVEAGEVVSVLGAPGSGKTRLALELAFLARPREGEVLFHGKNPMSRSNPFSPGNRPREVTLLVQNAEDQLFARDVFDDVAFGPRHLFLPDEEIEQRVVGALESVGLDPEEVRSRSPFALSGGERRRVALAGLLAMQPEVLILDEPTASLDPRTRNEFLPILEPLRAKGAIIWLTKSAREAALADRIYILENGRTVPVSAEDALYGRWRTLDQSGVELPAIYALGSALERRGVRLPEVSAPEELESAIIRAWTEGTGAR